MSAYICSRSSSSSSNMQAASEYRARVWRRSAAEENLVGTWESTAQSTWSLNPTAAASISIDEAPTPSPNSVFELRTSSPPITVSAAPTTTVVQPAIAHATNTCYDCHATATSTAPPVSSVNNASLRRQPQVPLIIAVVILSCLILVVLMVLGWLRFRRRRKIKQELVENVCLRHDSNADSDDSGRLQEKPVRSRSAISLTGPTLVPDANSSMRTLLPRSDVILSHRMAAQGEFARARDPRYSGALEDCHPAFYISPTIARDLPPIPPPKHRLIPKAPPSSPTLSARDHTLGRHSSRYMTRCEIPVQAPRSRLQDMSPVSPLSDQLDSPSVGLIGRSTDR